MIHSKDKEIFLFYFTKMDDESIFQVGTRTCRWVWPNLWPLNLGEVRSGTPPDPCSELILVGYISEYVHTHVLTTGVLLPPLDRGDSRCGALVVLSLGYVYCCMRTPFTPTVRRMAPRSHIFFSSQENYLEEMVVTVKFSQNPAPPFFPLRSLAIGSNFPKLKV